MLQHTKVLLTSFKQYHAKMKFARNTPLFCKETISLLVYKKLVIYRV